MSAAHEKTEDIFGEATVGERLATFLTAQNGSPTRVEAVRRFTAGFSWMTYGFVAEWTGKAGLERQRMVLRIGPPTGLFAPYRASPECIVLRALRGHGVPVPRIHFFSDAPEVFGAPFFICEHVAGTAPLPWVAPGQAAFDPILRARLAEQFVAALAALHRFNWRDSPVAALAEEVSPDNAAARQVALWEQALRRWQLREYPVVEQALSWLLTHCPLAPHVAIIHGDYRIGNFLVDKKEISAVLDWELVHMGDPHEDLGFMCLRAFGGKASDGSFLACHLLTRETLYERYTALSGMPVRSASVGFYELFNVFKLLVIHVGASRCFEDSGFSDLRMPAMGAQIPRVLLQIEKALGAVA
jgi:aminoglycoside phosphotransferase (APT) family kinase protein